MNNGRSFDDLSGGHDETGGEAAVLRFPGYDPSGLMGQIQAGAGGPREHPRDLVLSWLMSLPFGTDPAYAARSLLQGWPDRVAPDVAALLREVALYPRDRLEGLLAYRRRLRRSGAGQHRGRGRWTQLPGGVRLRGA